MAWSLRSALTVALLAATSAAADARTFTIENNRFVKDGQPFQVRSGALHYQRVPQAYWRHRLRSMKALGLNTVDTYVPWNFHEEEEGQFVFSGRANVTAFLQMCNDEGMLVMLRPGPYICAEWEMGGLPAWLLAKHNIRLRTYEAEYIAAVNLWWQELLPRVRPYMYSLGGPVVMMQIENEYGHVGDCENNADDARYMNHLLDFATARLGDTGVVFITVDDYGQWGSSKLGKGSPWRNDSRVLATVDGNLEADFRGAYQIQRDFNAAGHCPLMWSELWVGWFSTWGRSASNKTYAEVSTSMAEMMNIENSSFSLYMAHGGTSFGFMSGADYWQDIYKPDITSYDYAAPIAEHGGHNIGSDGGDLYQAVRDAIAAKVGAPPTEPEAPARAAYGVADLPEVAPLFDSLEALTGCSHTVPEGQELPLMEPLGFKYGLLLYSLSSNLSALANAELAFAETALHDRAQVFVDKREVGVAYRPECPASVSLGANGGGSALDILVENMGRVNFGVAVHDHKGLLGPPPAAGTWQVRCLPLRAEQVQALPFNASSAANASDGPLFRRGTLRIEGEPQDTYLDTRGLAKGYLWVNGQLLGRYWPDYGPQQALFAPAPMLRQGDNEVVILELHPASAGSSITSAAGPIWKTFGGDPVQADGAHSLRTPLVALVAALFAAGLGLRG